MAVCVECSAEIPPAARLKLYCPFCNKKSDKYAEVNNTCTIIDLLLLKEAVFRHMLLNTRFSAWRLCALVLLHLCSIASVRVFGLRIGALAVNGASQFSLDFLFSDVVIQASMMATYILCLRLAFGGIRLAPLAYYVLFSSFYSLFRILFSFWKYDTVQYFVIIEILGCTGNAIALNCVDRDSAKVFSTVVLAKLVSIILPLSIANYLQ